MTAVLENRVDKLEEKQDKTDEKIGKIEVHMAEIRTELRWIKWLLTVPLVQLAITVFQLLFNS